jgi:hypothetical protein
VILSRAIGFNHADPAGAEKESLSSAAVLRANSRPGKAQVRAGAERATVMYQ